MGYISTAEEITLDSVELKEPILSEEFSNLEDFEDYNYIREMLGFTEVVDTQKMLGQEEQEWVVGIGDTYYAPNGKWYDIDYHLPGFVRFMTNVTGEVPVFSFEIHGEDAMDRRKYTISSDGKITKYTGDVSITWSNPKVLN